MNEFTLTNSNLDENMITDRRFLNNDNRYYDIEQIIDLHGDSKFQYNTLHLNIRSLPKHVESLRTMLAQFSDGGIEFHFILLCETFLNEVNMSRCKISGYNLVSRNRKCNNRGGVAIYIRDTLSYTVRDDVALNVYGEFESIRVEVKCKKTNMLVGEIYRIPDTNEWLPIDRYETIADNINQTNLNAIIGTDQNIDYLKLIGIRMRIIF